MDKEWLLKLLSGQRVKDYTYTILFFLVFSFFVFAVIRPNIKIVFQLNKELADLKVIDDKYTGIIDKIIAIQTALESSRDDLYVLDEALPNTPQINQLINDIKRTAQQASLKISNIDIGEINLKDQSIHEGSRLVRITLSNETGFDGANKFIHLMENSRRLKVLKDIHMVKKDTSQSVSSGSAVLNFGLTIEGYYL